MSDSEDESILNVLKNGEITVQGEFLWGSNYTFSAKVEHAQTALQAVYKPTRGERPLWDFPRASLARREVAAYVVSQALGWRLVPATVYRRQGPVGPGSLQLFVEHDPEYHYFNFSEADRQRLRPVALFDLLINNADRKGSHILVAADQHLWLIDHGIGFHREDKLRTVIWDFASEPIPGPLCADLQRLRHDLEPDRPVHTELLHLLNEDEVTALAARADHLIRANRFPNPHPNRRPYPWPPV